MVNLRLLRDNDGDYKLLYKWYHNKKVYTYFEQRILTYNEIVDKYSQRTSLDSMTPVYMILYNNKPVGIIQYTRLSSESKRRFHIDDDGYEIDIDTWPGIPTYFEVEGKSEEDLENILNRLGYSLADSISCTADDIYKKYGKTMFEQRELRFENND